MSDLLIEECKEFWKNVYIAAVQAGHGFSYAEEYADLATNFYKEKFYPSYKDK